MREMLSLGLLLGQVGNGLFIIFTVIVYIYYFAYEPGSVVIKGMEITAYIVEICGFASLAYADFLLIEAVRMRKTMKAGFTFYIIMEVVMMIMELNSYRLEFYEPYSLALAIIHSIVSAAVCFSFLQLDPDKKPYEIIITICVGIIFGGMLGNIIGIRIYFSICMNAIAFRSDTLHAPQRDYRDRLPRRPCKSSRIQKLVLRRQGRKKRKRLTYRGYRAVSPVFEKTGFFI